MIISSKPHIKSVVSSNDDTVIGIICTIGGGYYEVTVPTNIWDAWVKSHTDLCAPIVLIADYIGVDNAELLVSGTCPTCWDALMDFEEL